MSNWSERVFIIKGLTPQPQSAEFANPGIGQLRTKDKLITIRTGHDGPLYSVRSNDEKVLAVDLSATEVSARFQELKELMEKSVADWAGIDQKYQQVQGPIETTPAETYEPKTIIMEHNQHVGGARP